MSQYPFYCSELSRRAAEKTYGTASVGDVWLLVEYPYEWKPKAFQESELAPEIKWYLSSIIKTIPRARLLFIKQDRPRKEHLSLFVVRCRESDPFILKFKLGQYRQLLDLDLASVAAGNLSGGGTITERPLYLVCTHGRRDKCCAKFGYPLYKSLKEMAGDFVWQSSHVGGDRFAANLVCFPHGLFYAHVTEGAGQRIITEYEQRRLALENYRGRACYSYAIQAAEYFIRAESGLTMLDELRHVDCQRLDEKAWRVKFIAPGQGRVYEAEVTGRMSEFQNFITCHASEEKSVIQYLLSRYRVSSD
ncbi:MAG TPA: sucrase ferredoxin [Pyrinomonadaceae bacterium]|nr:sucrase ferredoxin [Pyrinomonadaceae bacterium]